MEKKGGGMKPQFRVWYRRFQAWVFQRLNQPFARFRIRRLCHAERKRKGPLFIMIRQRLLPYPGRDIVVTRSQYIAGAIRMEMRSFDDLRQIAVMAGKPLTFVIPGRNGVEEIGLTVDGHATDLKIHMIMSEADQIYRDKRIGLHSPACMVLT